MASLKLMIPGPIQPDPEVLRSMGGNVRPHYGPDFTQFYNETIELLRSVLNTRGSIFLMVGSGTSAIDACIGSALSTGDKIIIGTNGFFGNRLISIARSYGLEVIEVRSEEGKLLQANQFEDALHDHPDARAIAVVHLETSTTIVNPIEDIGKVSKQHGTLFIIDAVSSLGGLPVKMDEWGIDLCASATQKCLGAPPGLAPVAVSDHAWTEIDKNPSKNHGWYADLRVWRQYATDWADWHPFPITMATNNVAALNTSLKQLLNEGIPSRLERYRNMAMHLRKGLRKIGYEPFTPDELLAPVLTAAYTPDGIPSTQVVTYLEQAYQIKISHGLGPALKDKIIRIGHMSPVITKADLDQVIAALSTFPRKVS